MLKKGIIAVLIISFVFVMSIMSFSENDEYVNIINPEVGESGKIISDNSLFFSIFVIKDVNLTLDLIKIDTPVFVFEEENESTKEEIEEVILAAESEEVIAADESEEVIVAVESEEVFEEEKILASSIEEEKILVSSIEEEEIFNDVEFLVEKPEQLTKENISIAYQNAEEEYEDIKKDYFEALENVENIPDLVDELSEDFDPTYELTDEDRLNLEILEIVSKIYNDRKAEFNYWEEEYFKLFENKILSDLDIDVDSLLPYFEYTVNGIEEGTYQLVIKLKETNEVVELLEFEVVTEENLVEEMFEDIFGDIDYFDEIIETENIE